MIRVVVNCRYDHETDEEWAQMVQKEAFVLRMLAAVFPDMKLPKEMLEEE